MIYFAYVITACIVVFLSVKAANYVDIIDKRTKLSGAFLGGIILAAVTSFPEFFTSISAVAIFARPGLCTGNVLGSNLFNLAALSLAILLFFKKFSKGRVSKGYRNVTVLVFLIYLILALNFLNLFDLTVLNLSITSILIAVIYLFGAKYLSVTDDFMTDEDLLDYQASRNSSLGVEQAVVRFILSSIGIVVFSVLMTYLTDMISQQLGLVQGFAGAIFLGVTTSLPEVTLIVALFGMKNYNIAVGNIVGSNLFNFLILGVADVLSIVSGVYTVADHRIVNLMIFGTAATVLFWILLKFRNKTSQAVCALAIIACYAAFLLL